MAPPPEELTTLGRLFAAKSMSAIFRQALDEKWGRVLYDASDPKQVAPPTLLEAATFAEAWAAVCATEIHGSLAREVRMKNADALLEEAVKALALLPAGEERRKGIKAFDQGYYSENARLLRR